MPASSSSLGAAAADAAPPRPRSGEFVPLLPSAEYTFSSDEAASLAHVPELPGGAEDGQLVMEDGQLVTEGGQLVMRSRSALVEMAAHQPRGDDFHQRLGHAFQVTSYFILDSSKYFCILRLII